MAGLRLAIVGERHPRERHPRERILSAIMSAAINKVMRFLISSHLLPVFF
jgi:hypothetical protein